MATTTIPLRKSYSHNNNYSTIDSDQHTHLHNASTYIDNELQASQTSTTGIHNDMNKPNNNIHYYRKTQFIAQCSMFVLMSSLPRIISIINLVLSLCIYHIFTVIQYNTQYNTQYTMWQYIHYDILHYRICESPSDILLLQSIKCIVLLYTFAYSRRKLQSSLYISCCAILMVLLCVVLKYTINTVPYNNTFYHGVMLCCFIEVIILYTTRRRSWWKLLRLYYTRHINSNVHNAVPEFDYVHGALKPSVSHNSLIALSRQHSTDQQRTLTTLNENNHIIDMPSTQLHSNIYMNMNNNTSLSNHNSIYVTIDAIQVHCQIVMNKQYMTQPQYNNHQLSHIYNQSSRGELYPYTIILIHDFSYSLIHYQHIVDVLKQYYHCIIVYDRVGYGLTSKPMIDEKHTAVDNNPYTIQYDMKLLIQLLSIVGINIPPPNNHSIHNNDSIVLCGHGSGVNTAFGIALQYNQLVTHIISMSHSVYTDIFSSFVRSIFKTNLGTSMINQLIRGELGDTSIRKQYYDDHSIPPYIFQYAKQWLDQSDTMYALQQLSKQSFNNTNNDIINRLHELNTKLNILLIHGDNDKQIPLSDSIKLQKKLMKINKLNPIELHTLADTGHALIIESSDDVCEIIIEYLHPDNQLNDDIEHSQSESELCSDITDSD